MATRHGTSERTGQKNRQRGKGSARPKKNGFGNFCLVLQALVSLTFMGVVILLDMLPLKYLGLAAMVLFFLWCITFVSQAARKKRGIPGKLYSLLMVAVLALGTYYVAKTNDMFAMITSGGTKVDSMVVAVLSDDPAETLEEASEYVYGVQFEQGADNMQAAVLDIEDQLGVNDLNMTEYGSVQEQAEALVSGEVQAIIYNQSYTELMDEAVEGYSDQIKILYRHEIETKLDFGGSEEDDSLTKADLIRRGIQAAECKREEAILVGDSAFDAHGANEAGIPLLAVTYGFGFRSRKQAEESGAALVAETAGEIPALLGVKQPEEET